MSVAFQKNAFQNGAFQEDLIVSSLNMPYPVNCVLIGEQLYFRPDKPMFEMTPRKTQKIAGDAPSFTVKTSNKGY